MKTRIIEPTEQKPNKPIKYPCLMKNVNNGSIAYAVNETDGVNLQLSSSGAPGAMLHAEGLKWTQVGYTHMRGRVVIEFDMEDGQ